MVQPVNSCSYLALQAQDREVVTVEGLGGDEEVGPLQRASQQAGVQCGFCTPGMLVSATASGAPTPIPLTSRSGSGSPGTSAGARGTSASCARSAGRVRRTFRRPDRRSIPTPRPRITPADGLASGRLASPPSGGRLSVPTVWDVTPAFPEPDRSIRRTDGGRPTTQAFTIARRRGAGRGQGRTPAVRHPQGAAPGLRPTAPVARAPGRPGGEARPHRRGRRSRRRRRPRRRRLVGITRPSRLRRAGRAARDRATRCCTPRTPSARDDVLVANGDFDPITAADLRRLLASHRRTGAAVTLGSTVLDRPGGYGRVVRDGPRVTDVIEGATPPPRSAGSTRSRRTGSRSAATSCSPRCRSWTATTASASTT